MGRMYSATFEEVTVSAVQDLFQILAAATTSVKVHGVVFSQSSDAGDAESEMLNILIHRGSTNGTAGTTPTPTPLDINDVAAVTVVEANNTGQGTEGPFIHSESFNVLAGIQIWWTPETRPIIAPSDLFHVELQTTPNDDLVMSGTIYFEEELWHLVRVFIARYTEEHINARSFLLILGMLLRPCQCPPIL